MTTKNASFKPLALMAIAAMALAFSVSCSQKRETLSPADRILSKNFPLLWAICSEECTGGNVVLDSIENSRMKEYCNARGKKCVDAALWESADVDTAAKELAALCNSDARFSGILAGLRKKGYYCIYDSLADSSFTQMAFRQDIAGINNLLGVYGKGKRPYYASIDSISFEVTSGYFEGVCEDIRSTVIREAGHTPRHFSISLLTAVRLLEANDRTDAANFEPLEEGLNKEACDKCRSVKWENYPYSVILVPGYGPEIAGQPLSPNGRLRAEYAAMLHKEGKAPFLIVSGGTVHPRLTPYNEAVEMRRYLMETCGVKPSAIFIEPHARHTTTNIRNAVRIMRKAGMPLDKPALISSSKSQLDYITGKGFRSFCEKMMLTVPFTTGERIEERQLEFHPLGCASQINPIDPLDP